MMNSKSTSHVLSLFDIALWHDVPGIAESSVLRASVPTLQRGLVWRPHHVELLWDSLLRGFPVGALVVSEKIASQVKQEDKDDDRTTHHLLDGQQRCNAIALGFKDSFDASGSTSGPADPDSILWIDLNPSEDEHSTREFLIRLTTRAHPWGYRRNDAAERLSTAAVREALKEIANNPADAGYQRPRPADLWPREAVCPVPLAWLLLSTNSDEQTFWSHVKMRLNRPELLRWARSALEFLLDQSTEAVAQRTRVFKGIKRACETRILALCAPSDLMTASRQEGVAVHDGRDDISSIEHLFQRLNQQGTRLEGEELAYSMIKAYWPQLAGPMDRIATKRMPASRMVALGIRAALAQNKTDRLPNALGVSGIRALARKSGEKTEHIHSYIATRLEGACELLDELLRYDAEKRPACLLPFHLTSIALRSPDVYLLIIIFADRLRAQSLPEDSQAQWGQALSGMATVLHWFGLDQSGAANRIFAACSEVLSIANIRQALDAAIQAGEVCCMHSPEAVKDFLLIRDDELVDWNWGKPLLGDGSEEIGARLNRDWGLFLDKLRRNRELLLYAQRCFINQRFQDYDPAVKDFWEEHNRPWDFDHILASKYLYWRKGGEFKGTCDHWVGTIGNLRAWPFEDNRSDQAESAMQKIGYSLESQRASFMLEDELSGFSVGEEVRHTQEAARAFVNACCGRMLRIYSEWYEKIGGGWLVSAKAQKVAEQEPAGKVLFHTL